MKMDELNEIDWDNLFPEGEFQLFEDVSPSLEDDAATGIAKENTIESWVEELLMKDDDEHDNNQAQLESSNDFLWSDLLLDTPQQSDEPASLPNSISNSSSCSNSEDNVVRITSNCSGGDVPNFESNGEKSENDKSGDDVLDLDDDTDHDDPLSKKRKRQLRNRDAAMRSRERKKMYVKDLEIKSRYMEAECRRLGRLLQCCYAENQMLRISLGSAYGASMAIPESAVLLLESLLLVSLVWLMVNICLLPRLPLQNQDAVPHGSVERKELESATPERKRMKVTELWVTLSFMRSKRCRASRTKMKSDFERAVLCN